MRDHVRHKAIATRQAFEPHNVRKPGLEVRRLFDVVRYDVMDATNRAKAVQLRWDLRPAGLLFRRPKKRHSFHIR